jgi:hypothetical protein
VFATPQPDTPKILCGTQPAGDGNLTATLISLIHLNPCGSWLASEGGLDFTAMPEGSIASKLAPTISCSQRRDQMHRKSYVGPSLLAMATSQPP